MKTYRGGWRGWLVVNRLLVCQQHYRKTIEPIYTKLGRKHDVSLKWTPLTFGVDRDGVCLVFINLPGYNA